MRSRGTGKCSPQHHPRHGRLILGIPRRERVRAQAPIPGGERRRILPWDVPWDMPWDMSTLASPKAARAGNSSHSPAPEPQLRGLGGSSGEPSGSTFAGARLRFAGWENTEREQPARWTLPKNPTSFRKGLEGAGEEERMGAEKKKGLKSMRSRATKGIFSTNLCVSSEESKWDAP